MMASRPKRFKEEKDQDDTQTDDTQWTEGAMGQAEWRIKNWYRGEVVCNNDDVLTIKYEDGIIHTAPPIFDKKNKEKEKSWSREEKVAVMRHFKKIILLGKIPSKDDIEKCQKKEKCLRTRSRRNIKDYCRSQIKMLTCKIRNKRVDKTKEVTPAYYVDDSDEEMEENNCNSKEQDNTDEEMEENNCCSHEQDNTDKEICMQEAEESPDETEAMLILHRIVEPEQVSDIVKSDSCVSDPERTSSINDCKKSAGDGADGCQLNEHQQNSVEEGIDDESYFDDSEDEFSTDETTRNSLEDQDCGQQSVNTDDNEMDSKKSMKPPCRLCVFCNKFQTKLSRHIAHMHQHNERVQRALKLANADRIAVFDAFKREGILMVNKKRATQDSPKYERERMARWKGDGELVQCATCQAFLSKQYLKRHMKNVCQLKSQAVNNAITLQVSYETEVDQFKEITPAYVYQIESDNDEEEMEENYSDNSKEQDNTDEVVPIQEAEKSTDEHEAILHNRIGEPEQPSDIMKYDSCIPDSELTEAIVSEIFPSLQRTSSIKDCTPEAMEVENKSTGDKTQNSVEEVTDDGSLFDDSDDEVCTDETRNPLENQDCGQQGDSEMDTNSYKKLKKPCRLCIFCNKFQTKLSRHIALSHKRNERVQMALKLTKADRFAAFDMFKKEGILKVNKEQAKLDSPKYERERMPSCKDAGELIQCATCQAFLSKRYLKCHLKNSACRLKSQTLTNALTLQMTLLDYKNEYGTEFVENILSRFKQNSKTERLCVRDPMLVEVGRRLWGNEKKKKDSKVEASESVMADMRQLASLYIILKKTEHSLGELPVKKGNVCDMFQRSNFKHLDVAVYTYAQRQSKSRLKAKLKQELYHLLKSASRIIKATYLIEDEESLAAEVDQFLADLELNKNVVFGDVTCALKKQTGDELKTPSSSSSDPNVERFGHDACALKKKTRDELKTPSSSSDPNVERCQPSSSSTNPDILLGVKVSDRKYSKWRKCEEESVLKFFSAYLNGEANKRLPGKAVIEEFLESQPHFRHDVYTVRTKVMNEVYKQERMAKTVISSNEKPAIPSTNDHP